MPVDNNAIVQSSTWGVDEDVTEAYGKVTFGGSLGSVPFTANAGVRFVQTPDQQLGLSVAPTVVHSQLIEIRNDYLEPLPSLNFNFNLAEDKLLRVGLARVIARPPLDELRASRSLWNETPPPTGSGGNPLLDPFVANQADVSFEWYFGPRRWPRSRCSTRMSTATSATAREPVTIDGTTYAVTGPFNGEGGGIAGAELTFQTPFAESGIGRNFGVYMNYAYVDTDVKEFYPSTNPLPMEGYAENTAAVDLWFNSAGWELRAGIQVPLALQHHRGLERLGRAFAGRRNASWTSAGPTRSTTRSASVCR